MQPTIAIVGAGPSGLTSAICFARRGIKSIVFESAPNQLDAPTYNPNRSYAIDITGHGLKAIRYIDAVERFDASMTRFKGIKINGVVRDPWSDIGWIGSRGDIVNTLIRQIQDEFSDLVTIEFNRRVSYCDVFSGELKLENCGSEQTESNASKRSQHFDLIIAADGNGSNMRDFAVVQDPEYRLEKSDKNAYCKMITLDRNTDELDPHYLHILSTRNFAVAGAISHHSGNPLWFCQVSFKKNNELNTLAALKSNLRKKSPRLLHHCSDEELAEFVTRDKQNVGRITSANKLYAGKMIFLGDASMSYPPIGQGVNSAMESAIVLDQSFEHVHKVNGEPLDLNQLQNVYNQAWLPEAQAISWCASKLILANRWHGLRALLLDQLGVKTLQELKSATIPYSQVYKDAKRFGVIWSG